MSARQDMPGSKANVLRHLSKRFGRSKSTADAPMSPASTEGAASIHILPTPVEDPDHRRALKHCVDKYKDLNASHMGIHTCTQTKESAYHNYQKISGAVDLATQRGDHDRAAQFRRVADNEFAHFAGLADSLSEKRVHHERVLHSAAVAINEHDKHHHDQHGDLYMTVNNLEHHAARAGIANPRSYVQAHLDQEPSMATSGLANHRNQELLARVHHIKHLEQLRSQDIDALHRTERANTIHNTINPGWSTENYMDQAAHHQHAQSHTPPRPASTNTLPPRHGNDSEHHEGHGVQQNSQDYLRPHPLSVSRVVSTEGLSHRSGLTPADWQAYSQDLNLHAPVQHSSVHHGPVQHTPAHHEVYGSQSFTPPVDPVEMSGTPRKALSQNGKD